MAELVQKQDVIAVPAHQQRLRAAARRRPGLDKGVKELLRIGSQDQHCHRSLVRVENRGCHVQIHLVAGWAAEEIAKDRVPRGDRLRDQLLRTGFENGQMRIEREENSAVPAGNDHILVAVRRANRLHVLLNLGRQGGTGRSLQPLANGRTKGSPSGMHAGIAQTLVPPGDDLVGFQSAMTLNSLRFSLRTAWVSWR